MESVNINTYNNYVKQSNEGFIIPFILFSNLLASSF